MREFQMRDFYILKFKLILFYGKLTLGLSVFFLVSFGFHPLHAAPLKVVTTNYPLFFFSGEILGDEIEVFNIVPPGAEVHEFIPSPKKLRSILEADLFIYLGFNLEPWADKMRTDLKRKNIRVIKIEDFTLNDQFFKRDIQNPDPHIWLDPLLALKLSQIIYKNLVEIIPNKKDTLQRRFSVLSERLRKTHDRFVEGLTGCRNGTILTTHKAFDFLSKRYQFKDESIYGISTEADPTPKRIIELIKLIKKEKITIVFTEPLINDKYAEILADETGAEMLSLHPLGSLSLEQMTKKQDYFYFMRENLTRLRAALDCDSK
ncbi:MAG: zinc ABC transporter substrate-binding protein [Deltaproteobacteria bacterium]|nr:zinc ABC transporter substrate-binding protein [Deltaproteobacteria bacterium]